MKSILQKNKRNIALLIGNGINRYGDAKVSNSWHDLLIELAEKRLPKKLEKVPSGVSLTEFYDVLELQNSNSKSSSTPQQAFCELMKSWKWYDQHKTIVEWAITNQTPVLTTNFEQTLSNAGNCKLFRTKKNGFTTYYPWDSYYGLEKLSSPENDFGIWHVNGMERYHQSIRLGLTHYMGSVQRARTWFHRGGEKRLFSGKSMDAWKGSDTWLQIIFTKPLLIFGLELDETEVFLRWLLLERANYYKKFPHLKKESWYIHKGPIKSSGKKFFLEGVGVKTIQVDTYDDIYGLEVWI